MTQSLAYRIVTCRASVPDPIPRSTRTLSEEDAYRLGQRDWSNAQVTLFETGIVPPIIVPVFLNAPEKQIYTHAFVQEQHDLMDVIKAYRGPNTFIPKG